MEGIVPGKAGMDRAAMDAERGPRLDARTDVERLVALAHALEEAGLLDPRSGRGARCPRSTGTACRPGKARPAFCER